MSYSKDRLKNDKNDAGTNESSSSSNSSSSSPSSTSTELNSSREACKQAKDATSSSLTVSNTSKNAKTTKESSLKPTEERKVQQHQHHPHHHHRNKRKKSPTKPVVVETKGKSSGNKKQSMDGQDPPTTTRNYEIQTLSDDQDYDYEENEEYESTSAGGIVMVMPSSQQPRRSELIDNLTYFDESELQPTTANMILGFEAPKNIIDDIITSPPSISSSAIANIRRNY